MTTLHPNSTSDKDTWTDWICELANESSKCTLEPSPYAGLTGCSLAWVACSIDDKFLPLLRNPWTLVLDVLAILQYHLVPIFFAMQGKSSDYLRILGKAGIIFQIYYATEEKQLHAWVRDTFHFDMKKYAFVISIGFVFLECVILHGACLVIKKMLSRSSGNKEFAELRIRSSLSRVELDGKPGYTFEFSAPCDHDDIKDHIPGIEDVNSISVYVEQKRHSDHNEMTDVQWPVVVKRTEDPKKGIGFITGEYKSQTGDKVYHQNFRHLKHAIIEDDILIFYKDTDGMTPFKNVYMCVPRAFRRCWLYFFVQTGLMMYYIYFLNNDSDTRDVAQVSVVKWIMAVIITCISGDDESGSVFDWLFWRRMFVNLRDANTDPTERDVRMIFWCIATPLWLEWRIRQLMDFLVNSMFRAILLGTAPILLSVEEPMDFIKDVLAIFFIVKLDDYDQARSWHDDDVLEEAMATQFIKPSINIGHLPGHVIQRHLKKRLHAVGVAFMYQSPDEDLWMDFIVDAVTAPVDHIVYRDQVADRPAKKRLRRMLNLDGKDRTHRLDSARSLEGDEPLNKPLLAA